jgi:hypothetical protein
MILGAGWTLTLPQLTLALRSHPEKQTGAAADGLTPPDDTKPESPGVLLKC